jgi:predicted  nucleic acid-binding Zn-ribbon protein
MDYIQEDLDNMGKELDFWMKDKIVQTQKLEDEERKTEIELEALVSQLRAVEQSIMEEDLRIKDMKGSVLRNEETIKSMLGSVVRLAGQ